MLIERLVTDAARVSSHDFGRDILPEMLDDYRVFGYTLKGYWRDVGTVDAYWQANMDLLVDLPELDLYNQETAIRVGGRRGKPVVLTVDAGAMHRAGHVFHVSANGVWLTGNVPPEFLRFPG